jgi:hypothetical protein
MDKLACRMDGRYRFSCYVNSGNFITRVRKTTTPARTRSDAPSGEKNGLNTSAEVTEEYQHGITHSGVTFAVAGALQARKNSPKLGRSGSRGQNALQFYQLRALLQIPAEDDVAAK